MHEKGLQRQIGVGTLVNSQQRRALAVPVINRGETGGQPVVNRTLCSSTGLHRIPFARACEETSRTVFYSMLEAQRGCWFPRRPKCRHLVLPSVAPLRRPPCAVPTRPACCVSGFWTRQVYIGFALLVLPKRRSGQVSSMLWTAGWLFVSWANQSVGVPKCLAPLRPATPPCAAPPRPARGMSGFRIRQVGLHRILFVCACYGTFRTLVFRGPAGPSHPWRTEPSASRPAPPALLCRPSVRRLASTCPQYVRVPGHALHKKGLQRQISDGTLVSSQERRAAVVPLINHL